MKKLLFTLICFASSVSIVQSQLTWTQKASMKIGRRSTSGCTINGKGYTGMGIISNGSVINDFWEYDTLTNIWSQKTNYPGIGLAENTFFAINGKLYVCLGNSSSIVCQYDVWEFDPIDSTWTQKNNFPGTARYGARAFVIGDSAFVVAGTYGNSSNYLYDMYMYNPTTDTWTQKANFPGGSRAFGIAFSFAGFGYFGLGASSNTTATNDLWKYNPVSDTWSSVANFPGNARSTAIDFIINNKVYVGTGNGLSPTVYYNDFYIYNPSSNTWQLSNITNTIPARTGAISFSFGNDGYVGYGINSTGVLMDVWALGSSSFSAVENYCTNNNYLEIFPIPAYDQLTIEASPNALVEILNINGQLIRSVSRLIANSNKMDIEISDFPSGVYILKMITEKGIVVKKFIKK